MAFFGITESGEGNDGIAQQHVSFGYEKLKFNAR